MRNRTTKTGYAEGERTHCKNGHEWIPENIYIFPKTGQRSCLLCKRESSARTELKKRKARVPKPARIHCDAGHPWIEENIHVDPNSGKKSCAVCNKERARLVNERERLAKPPKTHCRHGHDWVPENIYILPSTGEQKCLLCIKESAHRTAVKNGKGKGRTRVLLTHCKRGHEFTEENTYYQPQGGRACRTCRNEKSARDRADRKDDPVHQQNLRNGRARWQEKNPKYHKYHGLLRDYKMTQKDYENLLAKQDNKCAICERELEELHHIDHDHSCCPRARKTCGKCVRGILCPTCNQGLGQFKDDEERLRKAADYLKSYKENLSSSDSWLLELDQIL